MSSGQERDDAYFYGPWPWIVGIIGAALLIWFMFHLADGFA
ncbi:MAG: hypothetical protein WA888_19925 [Burkholderiaceae bacterium]